MYKYNYNFKREINEGHWNIPNEAASYIYEGETRELHLLKYLDLNMVNKITGLYVLFCNGVDCYLNSENQLTTEQKSEIDTLVSQYKLIS